MMGSLLDVAVRRAGEGGFDKPVAVFAAVAAAASLLLMPVDILEQLVLQTGLPDLFPPADPPLGLKARAAFALVAAILAFAASYGLMRLLGRGSAPAVKREVDEDLPLADPVPRMRRRDLHPDAPVRAPLSALRDLGHPGEVRAPLFQREPEPEPEPEPEAVAEPVAEEPEDELILTEPEVAEQPAAPLQPEAAQEAVPAQPAEEVEPAPPHRHSQPQGQETIAELLARLERALEAKSVPQHVVDIPKAAPPPAQEAEEPMDARLRSALENLKRFAPSHG